MPTLTFVILNYNCASETIELTDSILAWGSSVVYYSVVVVDNCSTDDSLHRLESRFAHQGSVCVIKSERNGGYSYGNNYGVRFALEKFHPDYIAIANPDICVDQGTVESLLETFSLDVRISMCSPIMRNQTGEVTFSPAALPSYMDDLKCCFTERHHGSLPIGHLNCEKKGVALTEVLPGSFFVARMDCFCEVGMFDEGVFLFCEERILGHHMKVRGYLLVLREDLSFVHAHSPSVTSTYDLIDTWKIIWKSRIYYQKNCVKVNPILLLLLKGGSRLFLLKLFLLLHLRAALHQ